MNMKFEVEITKKEKYLAAIFSIVFLAYNVLLFAIFGFAHHKAAFWLSWLFMVISFLATSTSMVILGKKGLELKDWLFGYPIIKHSTVYLVVEFVISTVFVLLDKTLPWGIAFSLQFLILCVYCICAISCFMAKETVQKITENVSDKTRYIKLLRVDAEMLAEKCKDKDVKDLCVKLAESIRYSDPMSNESLFELEKELALTISECDKAISVENYRLATELCEKAMLQLTERNKKCKALK